MWHHVQNLLQSIKQSVSKHCKMVKKLDLVKVQTKLLSRFSEESERMMLKKVSLPRASMKISVGRANDGAVTRDGQLKFPKAMKRKFKPLVETDDEENQPLAMRRVRASAGAKLAAGNASSSAADAAASEAGVTGLVSGRKLKLVVRRPELEYKINMETAEAIARQAQRQMRRFTSTFTEMCTSFKTSKKKYEELGKQVSDLKGQIQHWEDEKANWDEKKKELERERDEARKEALEAVGEKRDLEAEDAKVPAKKAIYEGLGNFVAHLANCEGRSLEDYVNEFVKEMPRDDRPPSADGSVHVAGHEGDGAIKYEAP